MKALYIKSIVILGLAPDTWGENAIPSSPQEQQESPKMRHIHSPRHVAPALLADTFYDFRPKNTTTYTIFIPKNTPRTGPKCLVVAKGVHVEGERPRGPSSNTPFTIDRPVELIISGASGRKISAAQIKLLQDTFPNIVDVQDSAGILGKAVHYNFRRFPNLTSASIRVPARKTGEIHFPTTVQKVFLTATAPRWYQPSATINLNRLPRGLHKLMISCDAKKPAGSMQVPAPRSLRIKDIRDLKSLTDTMPDEPRKYLFLRYSWHTH